MSVSIQAPPQKTAATDDGPRWSANSTPKILLCSVFGPYAQDDEFGSRLQNPMELYHNQVTREQGPFSLRMFHRSWGLMLIQANIQAPCALLDFPTLDRFISELRENTYDIIGISSIIVNRLKVRKMCELIRQYQPQATIIVGGHIANVPDLADHIDADHIVQGEGVRWFRDYLGEDTSRPVRHPQITSGIGTRSMGVQVSDKKGDVAATVIPSVGCPLGCNFCSTSAMFGGKGKFLNFYQTGDELFDVMCQLEKSMQVSSFFMMDENFLLHRKRALRLLELMEQHDKSWALYVFSSANVLSTYTWDELIRLGISWVWMGLEGEESQYLKLKGIDTRELVKELQSHGIRVLGSTIIGLESHTPENVGAAIDYAVSHDTDFHQFMLYTPLPGTPLHAELSAQGRIMGEDEFHVSDMHGQHAFNYRHPHIKNGQESNILATAFQRDFLVNGPSVARIARTTLAGWKRYRQHPDDRIRRRFAWEARDLATTFAAAVSAARLYYRDNRAIQEKMSLLLKDLSQVFGIKSTLASVLGGRYVLRKIRQEEHRLSEGWTYEPPTHYEANDALQKLNIGQHSSAKPCQSVCPAPA